jgi:phosphoglycolate phosphatase-like HAD superfamily hydrolase
VKVIIFDFDGTIADSFDLVLSISNRLADQYGYSPVQPEEVKRWKNLSSKEIVRQSGVPLFQLPFLLLRLRRELKREIYKLKPIPGMKEALIALKRQGNSLGIVTSNSKENVTSFLKTHDIEELFDFLGSGLTLFGKGKIIKKVIRQNSLNPATVLYVGDETRDVEAARKIHIRSIAVSWGYNSSEALAKQNPDFLIHQPSALINLIQNLNELPARKYHR